MENLSISPGLNSPDPISFSSSFKDRFKTKVIWLREATVESLSGQSLLISVGVVGLWAAFGFSIALQVGFLYTLGKVIWLVWSERNIQGLNDQIQILTRENHDLNEKLTQQARQFSVRYQELGNKADALEQANQDLLRSSAEKTMQIGGFIQAHQSISEENSHLKTENEMWKQMHEQLSQSHRERIDENEKLMLERNRLSREMDRLKEKAKNLHLSTKLEMDTLREDLRISEQHREEMKVRLQIAERRFAEPRSCLEESSLEGSSLNHFQYLANLFPSHHPLYQKFKNLRI